MAQFYRVAGGSTQSRGVIPDIALPSAGDPEDFGESALEFAMPWGEIEPTDYQPVADLSSLIAMARSRHEVRLDEDEELKRLLEDVAEWEKESGRDSVSLLLETRREEMEEAEARRLGPSSPRATDDPHGRTDRQAR
jgi:carboxyl-terminal processing protease